MLRQILNSKTMARGRRTLHAACSLCKQGRGGRTIVELQLSQDHRPGSAMGKNSRNSPSSTSAPSEIMVLRPSVAALEVLAVVECLPVPGLTTPAFDNGSSPATVSMWEARRSVVNWRSLASSASCKAGSYPSTSPVPALTVLMYRDTSGDRLLRRG